MIQAKNSLSASKQQFGITAYLSRDAVRQQINKAVGKNTDRFIASIISAVTTTPTLQKCTSQSILSAALVGNSLQLSPSPQLGQFYMVPFYDSRERVTNAAFVIGYKGLYQLAIRSGQFKKLNALAIKEGELVGFDPLNEEIQIQLIEDEEAREAAPTIGYYAFFELVNGFRKAMYWNREKMQAHAERYSKGYAAHKGYTFWEKDFDGMAVKTMYRQLLKLAPMSIDIQSALVNDAAVFNERQELKEYVDTAELEEVPDIQGADTGNADAPKQEVPKAEKPNASAPAAQTPADGGDLFG